MKMPAFTDAAGMEAIRSGIQKIGIINRSAPVVQQNALRGGGASYQATAWFQVTGAMNSNGWYPATTILRNAISTSDNGRWYSDEGGEDFYIQDCMYRRLTLGKRYRGSVIDADVSTPQAFTLTTRTSDSNGVFTVGTAHGITVGDEVNVYWPAGNRTRMTVTEITDTTITLNGGTGTVLPIATTAGDLAALTSGAERFPAAIVNADGEKYQKIYINDGSSGAGAVATAVSTGIYKGYIYNNDLDGTWSVGEEVRVGLLGGTCYINQKVYTCELNGAEGIYDKYWNAGNYHILVDACDPDTEEPIVNLWLLGEHTLVLNDVDPDALPGGLT